MDELSIFILGKLYRKHIIGGRHTDFEHVSSGLPSHLKKKAFDAARELIKQSYLIQKPAHYGLQVSLSPRKLAEIEKLISPTT
jgi:hypothetical protein